MDNIKIPEVGDILLFEIHIIETGITYRRIGQYIEKHIVNEKFHWYNVESFLEDDTTKIWNVYKQDIKKNFGKMSKEEFERDYIQWQI